MQSLEFIGEPYRFRQRLLQREYQGFESKTEAGEWQQNIRGELNFSPARTALASLYRGQNRMMQPSYD